MQQNLISIPFLIFCFSSTVAPQVGFALIDLSLMFGRKKQHNIPIYCARAPFALMLFDCLWLRDYGGKTLTRHKSTNAL